MTGPWDLDGIRRRGRARSLAESDGGRCGPERVKHAAGRAWSAQVRAMTTHAAGPGWPSEAEEVCLLALEHVMRQADPEHVAAAAHQLAAELISGRATRATLGKLAMITGALSLGAAPYRVTP